MRWHLRSSSSFKGSIREKILRQRGIGAEEEPSWLNPRLAALPDAGQCPGLLDAVQVLADYLVNDPRPVLIWGDYDVDGICGAVIIGHFLSLFGRREGSGFLPHTPHRMKEGYGINLDTLRELVTKFKPGCLLTVDCGITNVDEIAWAKSQGLTVVVTDHHQAGSRLPPADVICDPVLRDNPWFGICGAATAFIVMAALATHLGQKLSPSPSQREKQAVLDLVALATLADVVPLTGPNRILGHSGMRLIQSGERPGMKALRDAATIPVDRRITADQIVYRLAPRINAAGRMESPELARELFTTTEPLRATELAEELSRLNIQRQTEENRIFQESMALADASKPAIVVSGRGWHRGVIGIVASKLVEQFWRPVIVLSENEDGTLVGSGRSIPGFNLFRALSDIKSASDLFHKVGGHAQAAGMTLKAGTLSRFTSSFCEEVTAVFPGKPERILEIDCELPFQAALSPGFLDFLYLLEPLGEGNPPPVFMSAPVTIRELRTFGADGRHLRVAFREQGGSNMCGKWWGMGARFSDFRIGQTVRAAFVPELNVFQGIKSVEMKIFDLLTDEDFMAQTHRENWVHFSLGASSRLNTGTKFCFAICRNTGSIFTFSKSLIMISYPKLVVCTPS